MEKAIWMKKQEFFNWKCSNCSIQTYGICKRNRNKTKIGSGSPVGFVGAAESKKKNLKTLIFHT